MGNELGWVLGADCPHCDRFAPAVPSPSVSWDWVMYCPCGVIFFTRNTYRRLALEMTPGERSYLKRISSEARQEEATS